MLLILIVLLLLLWFFTYQEGFEEGVDEGDEGDEDIIEEGLSIEDMNKQLDGTPQQPGSAVILNERKINILEQLSDKQSNQISDITTMITTIKTQKLANKPDNKLPV